MTAIETSLIAQTLIAYALHIAFLIYIITQSVMNNVILVSASMITVVVIVMKDARLIS